MLSFIDVSKKQHEDNKTEMLWISWFYECSWVSVLISPHKTDTADVKGMKLHPQYEGRFG